MTNLKSFMKQPKPKLEMTGIKHIIAVASGKGGVGKSTTAVNLALALSKQGQNVGLLDADIYGPSLPRMLNVMGKPPSEDGKTMQPLEAYGIKCMSIGFFTGEDNPTVWRGLMVMSAIEQLLKDVHWAPLDVLVIDLPPGTGDAHLTLTQRVDISGAVIVSTPQDIALIDARKGLKMFEKVGVPTLGLIENMSTFICPHCDKESDIFGTGGVEKEAKELGLPLLGKLPLNIKVRETSDEGKPIVITDPEHPCSKVYTDIAQKILKSLKNK